MKDKVIAASGELWHELGARGETSVYDLARTLGQDEELVTLALGWLAREDKIQFSERRNEVVFSLVDSEMQIFRGFYGDRTSQRKQSFWKRLFRQQS